MDYLPGDSIELEANANPNDDTYTLSGNTGSIFL